MKKLTVLLGLVVAGLCVSPVQGMKRRLRLLPRIGDLVVAGAGVYLGWHVGYASGEIIGYAEGCSNTFQERSGSRKIKHFQCERAFAIGSVLKGLEDFKELEDFKLDSMYKLEEAAQRNQHHVIYQKANNYGEFFLRLALSRKKICIKKLDWQEEKESSFGLWVEDSSWDIENLDLDLVSQVRERINAVMKMECQYFAQYVFSPRHAVNIMFNSTIPSQPFACNIELLNELAIKDTEEIDLVSNDYALLGMSILFAVMFDDELSRRKIEKEVGQIVKIFDELGLEDRGEKITGKI